MTLTVNTVVTSSTLTKHIALLPKGADVESILIMVQTAFDAGVTLSVGYSSNHTAYCTAQSVSSTGRIAPTLGSGGGYDSSPREVKAYLNGTPTKGKALVVMEWNKLTPATT